MRSAAAGLLTVIAVCSVERTRPVLATPVEVSNLPIAVVTLTTGIERTGRPAVAAMPGGVAAF